MTPNSAQNANPYMRCSYDMLAHDVYSSSTSAGVSGSLGSMPALRERTHRTVSHQSSVITLAHPIPSHRVASSPRRLVTLVVVARTSGGLYRCPSSPRSTSREVNPRARPRVRKRIASHLISNE
jgi:hypothetical protein